MYSNECAERERAECELAEHERAKRERAKCECAERERAEHERAMACQSILTLDLLILWVHKFGIKLTKRFSLAVM